MNKFTHISSSNTPKMVFVGDKKVTNRVAVATAIVFLGESIVSLLEAGELHSKKGPVFQTAIIAGIQAVKKTSELIPMCHPLWIEGIDIEINAIDKERVEVLCSVSISGKTGVEMEALTGASIAALTIYDMCKALKTDIVIEKVLLLEKQGGKNDFKRTK